MDAAQRADGGPSADRTGTPAAHAGRKREDSRPDQLERAVSARPASKLPQRRLLGRRTERGVLDRLVASIREGHSQALVLRGEAGVGKTALLDYVAESARGCLVVRAAGVESEMELPFAGLHQLCAPFLDRLDRLPGPQRGALEAAFGLRDGDSPDRFLVSMAVLSLLSVVAETRPLLWVVDDVHWLDRASVQALAFAARRLAAEPVGLIFAARGLDAGLTGLTELIVEGLPEGDARSLLDSVLTGPLDERVRDQIVAETRGNPLALVELARGLMPVELAGGSASPRKRQRQRPKRGWWNSGRGWSSGIRWCDRPRTSRRRSPNGRRRTAPWPRPLTRNLIPTAVPGTAPRPRPGRMRMSPPSSRCRQPGRRRVAASPQRPRSWNARRC